MLGKCEPHHDAFTAVLTTGLCLGLVLSYLPQHYRIISKNSSEGFSPWYLLLGSTSSASGMLNVIMLQWDVVKCCSSVIDQGVGYCLESLGGIIQVTLQWALFSIILVLFLIYFPPHLKYVDLPQQSSDPNEPLLPPRRSNVTSEDWRLGVTLAWVVAIHMQVEIAFVSFFLLTYHSPQAQIQAWATFLGVTSAGLAVIQYLPQLVKTYRIKLVGAISIPMMCIQTPGAILMVLNIILRPGTNWTSWITYATAGVMQGSLLVMCLIWKARQARLRIDDFGNKLGPDVPTVTVTHVDSDLSEESEEGNGGTRKYQTGWKKPRTSFLAILSVTTRIFHV
ncbi:hypothetical protein BU17DRAFT_77149 [Hysterangium stoloniferum]|nr:hypothetical protein BU17DRAFT_77149 [Hysterangium stoloniferum]